MKIYLAGKISKNDWRSDVVDHCLFPWDSFNMTDIASSVNGFPCSEKSIFGVHDYTGPYFVEDHVRDDTENNHGVNITQCNWKHFHMKEARESLIAFCKLAIAQSDLVFAWIDDITCYGTLVEIGYAIGCHIPVDVVFSSHLDVGDVEDLWFASGICSDYILTNDDAQSALKVALGDRGEPIAPKSFGGYPTYNEYLQSDH